MKIANLSLSATGPSTRNTYRTSPIKRERRTNAELGALHDAILAVCAVDHPLLVRGVFYRVMSTGAVEKSEKAYNGSRTALVGTSSPGLVA
jgi:hypothetical protein